MKKFLVICLIAILSSNLFGCAKEITTDKNKPTSVVNSVADTKAETNPATKPASVKLTPNEAVSIYMNNIDKWQLDPEKTYMSMGGYLYLFLDLNFDGVLELITSETNGSGRYSYNCFYKISEDGTTVELITFDESIDKNNQCDFFFDDSPVLFKDNATGDYQYVLCDYIRAGGGMDYFREEEYTYKDGKIYANPLFSYEVVQAEVSESGEKEEYFTLFNLDEPEKVDKETYDKAVKDYEAQRTNLDLDFETIDGADFSEANDIEKSDMLLDAYTDFSYNGFEFED